MMSDTLSPSGSAAADHYKTFYLTQTNVVFDLDLLIYETRNWKILEIHIN